MIGETPAGEQQGYSSSQGATAVVSHRVNIDAQPAYEAWLAEVAVISAAAPGFLDAQLVRPIAGVTSTYTIILRFDTVEHLKTWMNSDQRHRLINQAKSLFAGDGEYVVRSGLDFWFHAPVPLDQQPARWKQVLVTWSAIFPLVLVLPELIGPVLRGLRIPPNQYFDVFVISGASVALMVYLVMPPYVKLIRRWFLS